MTKPEEVARAICAEDCREWDSLRGMHRIIYFKLAKAAINALSEPTPEMCARGFLVPEAAEDPAGVFRAMIDVVLSEGK